MGCRLRWGLKTAIQTDDGDVTRLNVGLVETRVTFFATPQENGAPVRGPAQGTSVRESRWEVALLTGFDGANRDYLPVPG